MNVPTVIPLTAKEYAEVFHRNLSSVYTGLRLGSIPYQVIRETGEPVRIAVPLSVILKRAARNGEAA